MQNAFLTPQEEKPLITCKDCKTQECIKTKKVCDKVERLLKTITTGRRNWQTIVDPHRLASYEHDRITGEKGRRAKRSEWEE